eukprot:208491-Chlamydomonas_euryale.AAC.4
MRQVGMQCSRQGSKAGEGALGGFWLCKKATAWMVSCKQSDGPGGLREAMGRTRRPEGSNGTDQAASGKHALLKAAGLPLPCNGCPSTRCCSLL